MVKTTTNLLSYSRQDSIEKMHTNPTKNDYFLKLSLEYAGTQYLEI